MDDILYEAKKAIIEQRSKEWYDIKIGRYSSSEIWKLLPDGKREMTEDELKARPKTGKGSKCKLITDSSILADTTNTYILDKVAEVLTGQAKDFVDDATAWGIQNEYGAKVWYEKITEQKIEDVGFVQYGTHAGGSPDGFVGDEGMIEIKCPFNTTIHLQHCLATAETFKADFKEYYYQIQANLFFSERLWCDFISFDPRIQEDIAYFKLRIESNLADQQLIRSKLDMAIHEKEKYLEKFLKYSL